MKNDYTEKELRDQEIMIKKNILLVLVPIFLMIFVIGYFQDKSISYNEKKYFEFHNLEFHGKIINKRQEGDCLRCSKFLLLDNYYEDRVDWEIYESIKIGDSVYKKKNSDSIFYVIDAAHIIIRDEGKYLRHKYFKLIHKK